MNRATQLERLRLGVRIAGIDVDEVVIPTDRDTLAGHIRLHWLDWAARAGAPDVLLLHGGGQNAHTWDPTAVQFRPALHCIALDQRGHGDSEWALDMDYSIDANVEDIERFVDALELSRFVLIGMSMGGLNSIEFAARHSERLLALVLVDVGPELHEVGTDRIAAFTGTDAELESVDAFLERAAEFNPLRDREVLRTSLLHNLHQLPDGRWTWKYDRRHRGRVDPAAGTERRLRLAEMLPSIDTPTLVLRGAESDVFWDEDAERVAARIRGARWAKIQNAGHTIQGDNPVEFVVAVRQFLAGTGIPVD